MYPLRQGRLALVFCIALVALPGFMRPSPIPAQCLDYEGRLHWSGGFGLPADLSPGPSRVAVLGNLGLLVDNSLGLFVIDLGTTNCPRLLGTLSGTAYAATAAGGLLYLAASDSLLVVDLSLPEQPLVLGAIGLPAQAGAIAVAGDIAYAGLGEPSAGIAVLDVATPDLPALIVFIPASHPYNRVDAVAVIGSHLYVGDYEGALTTYSLADPGAPAYRSSLPLGDHVGDIETANGLLYVPAGLAGLMVLSLADPEQPSIVGALPTAELANAIALAGPRAYLANDDGGLLALDLDDPSAPQVIGHLGTYDDVEDVTLLGSQVLLADREAGLIVVEPGDGTVATAGHSDSTQLAYSLLVREELLFGVDPYEGLLVYDISLGETPVRLCRWPLPQTPLDLDIQGDLACIAQGPWGLMTVDISDPRNPAYLGSTWLGSDEAFAGSVVIQGSLAYVANDEGRLEIVDIASPEQPTPIGHLALDDFCQGVDVAGDRAFIAGGDGLWIADVSQPNSPSLIDSLPLPGSSWAVTVDDGIAYVMNTTAFYLVDVTLGEAPVLISAVHPTRAHEQGVGRPALIDGLAVVGLGDRGAALIDVSEPGCPVIVGNFDTPGAAIGTAVSRHGIYVADGPNGFMSLRPPCQISTEIGSLPLAIAGARLHPNVPNPFNPSTMIAFDLEAPARVRLGIYDLAGRELVELLAAELGAGTHQVEWNGRDARGRSLPSGVYFGRLAVGEYTTACRMTLLK